MALSAHSVTGMDASVRQTRPMYAVNVHNSLLLTLPSFTVAGRRVYSAETFRVPRKGLHQQLVFAINRTATSAPAKLGWVQLESRVYVVVGTRGTLRFFLVRMRDGGRERPRYEAGGREFMLSSSLSLLSLAAYVRQRSSWTSKESSPTSGMRMNHQQNGCLSTVQK